MARRIGRRRTPADLLPLSVAADSASDAAPRSSPRGGGGGSVGGGNPRIKPTASDDENDRGGLGGPSSVVGKNKSLSPAGMTKGALSSAASVDGSEAASSLATVTLASGGGGSISSIPPPPLPHGGSGPSAPVGTDDHPHRHLHHHHQPPIGGGGAGTWRIRDRRLPFAVALTLVLGLGSVGPNGLYRAFRIGPRDGGGGGGGRFPGARGRTAGKASWHIVDVNAPPVDGRPRMVDDDLHPTSASADDYGDGANGNPNGRFNYDVHPYAAVVEDNDPLGSTSGDAPSSDVDSVLLPFPVVHDEDDHIPGLDDISTTPASDALECRDSVIAFVINATDVKDECDGLRKAFDKTCSAAAPATSAAAAGGNVPHQTAVQTAGGGAAARGEGRSRKRRRLTERPEHKWVKTASRSLRRAYRALVQTWRRGQRRGDDGTFLYVEEMIADPLVWDKARRFVEAEEDLDGNYRREARRMLHENLGANTAGKGKSAKTEGPPQEQQQQPDVPPAQPQTQKQMQHIMLSPALPTSNKHIAGQMLNDALVLQEAGAATKEHIASAVSVGNATNVTDVAAAAPNNAEAIRDSFEARTCCASILNVFHEHCDHPEGEESLSDFRLFVIVFVIAFCGMVKSLIRYFKIRWLPEAAGCILVGVLGYVIMQFTPHVDLAFDGSLFLRVMVPPIVFEAALSIDKQSFQRHIIPIMIYAIAGTLLSTALTAYIVHRGTFLLGDWCTTIPFVEALTFGALISSIDPIAVLSVLSNMGMSDKDTIYVVIFGESLLNDGVAIVLFETLVHFLDESLVIDGEAVWAAMMHFIVVALGSVMVGALSSVCCTAYFWAMHECHTPLVEVLMFICWAFIPFFICDGVEWSGIVAVVTSGVIMDLYVVGQKHENEGQGDVNSLTNGNGLETIQTRERKLQRGIFTKEGHLSAKARNHIHFVTEINATLMETAIFSYLGLFLFSPRYHWNFWLTIVAIVACVLSRAVMIPTFSLLANFLSMMRVRASTGCSRAAAQSRRTGQSVSQGQVGGSVVIDHRMQVVLLFAGLRGAMSFALVENIPLFDTVTGQGSRLKPELKAMTSASIVFTVFILGGCTFYLMERLGYSMSKEQDMVEMTAPLVRQGNNRADKRGSPKVTTQVRVDTNQGGRSERLVRHRPLERMGQIPMFHDRDRTVNK